MDSVDYAYWAKYISEIHQTIGKKNDSALELGSGNGKLSLYLKDEFKSLYKFIKTKVMTQLQNDMCYFRFICQ